MRMPTSKSGGARFRGPTSSEEYNRNEDDKYLEMVELYKQANLTKAELKEAHQAILFENHALHTYIEMLEGRMTILESQLNSALSMESMNGRFSKTSFVQDMSSRYPKASQDEQVKTPRANIDLQHRFATTSITHEIPKTHLAGENGSIIVPKELKIQVGRSSKKGAVVDTDVRNAFDGDPLTFWRRTVTYESPADVPVTGEDVILEIDLPSRLVNNLNINTCVIHPHPERGIEIKDIEIEYNSGWESIKGFRQSEITSLQTDKHSPKRRWYFPSSPVQKVRITLIQHHPVQINGKTVFNLGAQEIGIYLTMFEPSGGMILTPFQMDGLYNIESIEHVFSNRGSFSYPTNLDQQLEGNIFEHELFIEDPDKTLRPLSSGDWSSQSARKLWVKTHLYPDPHNGVTPCLHAVRLHYTRM